jgi:hypothetical protein
MIELLASATAANSEPSGGGAGIAINDIEKPWPEFFGILVGSAAGSGVLTCTLRLWGYNPTVRAGCAGHTGWIPVGPGTGTTAGQLNGGVAITEVQADKLAHSEVLHRAALQHFTRLYLEIEAIGGTSTAIVAWLVWGKR